MYPNLLNMIHHIAADHNLQMKGDDPSYFDNPDHWPPETPGQLAWMNWCAGRFRDKEIRTYCSGNSWKVDKLTETYRCQDLHEFLDNVYSGPYHNYFFVRDGEQYAKET